jgi:GNAT superfamily N-acetyltransferase
MSAPDASNAPAAIDSGPSQAPGQQPAMGVQLPAHAPAAAGQATSLDLRDIHLPGAPPAWPPAPGWWLLGALILAAVGVAALRLRALRQAKRRRERIIAQLDGLRGQGCGPELLGAVSALLKRAALSRFPRTDVAALTGPAWLDFLDRTGGAGGFTDGPGRVLDDGAYAREKDCDVPALIEVARRWLRQNL